jgi:hypothetical protein
MALTISDELKSLIPPLTPEEYTQLEANLRKPGQHLRYTSAEIK